MNPVPMPQRWLLAVLGAVFLLDVGLAANARAGGLALPGAAVLLACVYLAVSRPELAGLAGAGALVLSSELIAVTHTEPVWIGIKGLLGSEVLAGGALVLLLAWRARAGLAVVGIGALTGACLAAVAIRDGSPRAVLDLQTLLFGLLVLVGGAGAGMYLRRSGLQRDDSQLRSLVRRQWPLAAALAVAILVDFGEAGGSLRSLGWTGGSEHLFGLVGAVVAAGCAVLAPLHPVRFAVIGAAAIGLPTVAVLTIEATERGHHLVPVTVTQLAASMALIAFATRYGQPHTALLSTVGLIVANAAGLLDRVGRFDRDSVLVVAFLLVVAVATGLYFRARDRERNQAVRVAVSGAQQAERMALARELHDVVAHHVTGIVVQAQAARLVADREPEQAVAALERIAVTGAEALTAMRMLVGSLREAEPAGGGTSPSTATTDLEADLRILVDQFAGPPVELELNLPERLPDELGRSVLRLVQESLTNVSKHAADAGQVRVRVACEGPELHVWVQDNGSARRGAPVGGSGGYGLVGMRERVALLGGYFSAGPATDGGWVVKVVLPMRSPS